MPDDQQETKDPVTETQESPIPSEEQKTPETPVEEQSPQETTELPEDAKERTKREFEKLRQDLREERQKREHLEKVFTSLQPKPEPRKLPDLIDPETGLFNPQAQNQRDQILLESQERARRAEEAAQQYALQKEESEMISAHPDLDPKGTGFNEKLSHLVAGVIRDSMLEPERFGGKQLSGKEAADYVKGFLKSERESVKQEGAKEALEQITPKEQAALEASGSSGRRSQVAPKLEELQYKSRKGGQEGLDAIVERLKGVPDRS